MYAGQLRTQVTIQRKQAGEDAYGDPLPPAWTDVATVWANVKHLSGAETIRSGLETSVVKASIRIRWRTGITAAMRVLVGGVPYAITAVLEDVDRRGYVDLVCERGANAG